MTDRLDSRMQRPSQVEELIDNIDGIVWEVDLPSFRFTFVSAQAESILGYPVARWLDDPSFWEEHIYADDREWCLTFCQDATARGVPHRFEYRMVAADGSVVWLRDYVRVVLEEGRPAKLRGVMVDITERKKAQEELEKAVSLLRATLDSTADGILATSKDGKSITAYNRKFAEMWRLPPEAFERTNEGLLADLIVEQLVDPAAFKAKARRLIERPDEESYDVLEFKDGRIFERYSQPQRLGADVIGRVWSFRDVTRRVRVEAERDRLFVEEQRVHAEAERARERMAFLAEASRKLAAAALDLDATLGAMAELAVPALASWCLVFLPEGISEHGAPTLGFSHEDPETAARLGPLLLHHLPGEGDPLGLAEPIRAGESTVDPGVPDEALSERTREPEDLSLFRALVASPRILVPLTIKGQRVGVLVAGTKVPRGCFSGEDRTLFEELGRRCATSLENVRLYGEVRDAIQVRDDFLSIASHELKTPLTTLTLGLELMMRRLRDGQPVELGSVVRLSNKVSQLTSLTNDLLDVSRIAACRITIHREPVPLRAVTREVVASAQMSRSHTVILEEGSEVYVEGDAGRLGQVVGNLIDNAMKYSPKGETIRVSVSGQRDEAVLSVSDLGIGIPKEQQEKLFERFFRARNAPTSSYGGLGLGLYICRDIVDRHEGRIWVESEAGRGATFYVALPRKAGPR